MTNLSPAYQSIIASLDIINKGSAREISVIWCLPLRARIVHDNQHLHSIIVDDPSDLDLTVANYLNTFAMRLIQIRQSQASLGKTCPL